MIEIGQRGPRFPFEPMNRLADSLRKIDRDSDRFRYGSIDGLEILDRGDY